MGLFERFARVDSPTIDVLLLAENGHEPAFIVQARVLSDRQNSKMIEDASQNNELRMDRFRKLWGQRVVVGWDILTPGNLKRLIPNVQIDEGQLELLYPNKVIPYTPDMAADLHLNAHQSFTVKINEATTEYRQRQHEEQDQEQAHLLGNSVRPSMSDSA